jgi:hypothetical protein
MRDKRFSVAAKAACVLIPETKHSSNLSADGLDHASLAILPFVCHGPFVLYRELEHSLH